MKHQHLRHASFAVVTALAGIGCSGEIDSQSGESPPAQSVGRPENGAPDKGVKAVPGGAVPGGAVPGGAVPGGVAPGGVASCGVDPTRLWELTPDQYTRTAQALIGTKTRPGDDLDQGQSREARGAFSEAHVSALVETARRLATEAAAAPAKLHPCLADKLSDAGCVRMFLQDFTTRAFRREMVPAEIDNYATYFQKQAAAHDGPTALRLVLRVIFASPDFIFRTELGPAGAAPGTMVKLTPFERASAISYFITDGPPDAPLLAAARANLLQTSEQIGTQSRRLLQSASSAPGVLRFFRERFRTHEILGAQKDLKLFKDFTADVPADMDREADAFVQNVMWQDGGKLDTLLTAGYSMVNTRLATLYGLPASTAPSKDMFVKATMPGMRAGLLSLGGVMARLGRIDDTAPVARGIFMREMLMCLGVPTPPAEVNAVPPPPDGKRTQRERLSQHGSDPTCAGCHRLFDPMGLAFETFDTAGRYRTNDLGRPIDTAGVLTGVGADNVRFSNAADLARLLASSPQTHACVATRMYAHAHGLGDVPEDRGCVVQRLGDHLSKSGGNLMDLVADTTSDDSFLVRRVQGP